LKRLSVVLKGCLLRRTKTTKGSDGELIVKLPSRHIENVTIDLSSKERKLYEAIENKAGALFNNLLIKKNSNIYSAVLTLILRLRQVATHPHLIGIMWENANRGVFELGFLNETEELLARTLNTNQGKPPIANVNTLNYALQNFKLQVTPAVFNRIQEQVENNDFFNQECPMCMDSVSNPAITKCGEINLI
jgi:SNF2 family DNA or RNA helicase